MSSSKTVSNLNIRKFPSYDSYKNATIGEDDLCVVNEGGQPIIEVANLPTASSNWVGRIVFAKPYGVFYNCFSDGGNPATYYWSEITVQYVAPALEQVSTMPTADSGNVDKIVQFTGATDATYTNGYIYKCEEDSGNPGTYLWTAIQVQAGGGGGAVDSVNGQTGTVVLTASDVGAEPTITGAATTITSNNLSAARALVSDSTGKVAVSTVTSTELGYMHGVTSAVQTQLNNKQATLTAGGGIDITSNTISVGDIDCGTLS